jgi:hypothetical protein
MREEKAEVRKPNSEGKPKAENRKVSADCAAAFSNFGLRTSFGFSTLRSTATEDGRISDFGFIIQTPS